MPLIVGLNHETAPIDLREKLSVSPARLRDWLGHVKSSAPIDEVVVLSTCNRTEVYARATDRRQAHECLVRQMQAHAQIPQLRGHLYYYENDQAVHHLFRVAAGLDSLVKGENEILSQVKHAYHTAQESGFTGKLMNVLFQRSFFVGKRVRTETGLSAGAASVGSVAVAMAQRIFGDLQDRTVMILGAGSMAELTAKHLLSQNVRSILVSNRTYERAQELAARFNGAALRFEEGLAQMASADIVICSTASPCAVVTPSHVKNIMQHRKGRSLFLIDIAVPRDVDPAVHEIDNVYVYNIDDLQKIVAENLHKRSQEVAAAERIVRHETDQFSRWLQAHYAGLSVGLKHRAVPGALAPLDSE